MDSDLITFIFRDLNAPILAVFLAGAYFMYKIRINDLQHIQEKLKVIEEMRLDMQKLVLKSEEMIDVLKQIRDKK